MNYKQYATFGVTMLDTLGVTRQDYIGKEKDIESSLAAHTSTSLSAGRVRKYDYEIGRFTSVDPLWEKYTGCPLLGPCHKSKGNRVI
ncbi:MAG TPA: hypothetical protein PLE30_11420, partial [Candidatus Kapabacteria bacterium]|nr:hypothetical protein [Candidatus Kapabacteria bacterium]